MDIQAGTAQHPDEKCGTMVRAWEALLVQTEEMAKCRLSLADKMLSEVTDPLKQLAHRKEDARRRHVAFAQKLTEERQKFSVEKDKAKEKYEHMCDVVDLAKQKHEKAPDDKAAERLKKQWHADIMEMNNSKNNYVVSLEVANALKKRYYYTDMPILMDQLQAANEHRIHAVKTYMSDYLALETEATTTYQKLIMNILTQVKAISPEQDSNTFLHYHRNSAWVEPADFKFEPTLLWKDTPDLVTDEQAKIYLTNKLAKFRLKLEQTLVEIENKHKELDGLRNLYDAYLKNPKTGDPDEVNENMIETIRAITLLELQKTRYLTSINTLTASIGEADDSRRHTLAKSTFAIPTTCDYCQEKIWGLTQQGMTCKDCGYNCHAKCELKVPPYCQTTKPALASSLQSKLSKSNLNLAEVTRSPSLQLTSNPTSPQQLVPGNKARAVYRYEATNADELTVASGDVVTVVEPDSMDGWIKVELKGKSGLVPLDYIEPMVSSDPSAGATRSGSPLGKKAVSRTNLSPTSLGSIGSSMSNLSSAAASAVGKKKVRAVYDYAAQTPQELTIHEGDVIEVIKQSEDGWWEGILNGKRGEFPGTYVEPM